MSSGYLDHLPAVFREDPVAGQFLTAFEAVLTGGDSDTVGIEQLIGRAAAYLDPRETRPDFLPWLAGWVALSLRAEWDTDTRRGFVQEAVSLYRLRGTPAGLRRILEIYLRPLDDEVTRDDVVVFEFDQPAHYFQVQLTLGDSDPARLRRVQEAARAIIDLEKPAHTFYALRIVVPTMRLVPGELVLGKRTGPGATVLGTRETNQ